MDCLDFQDPSDLPVTHPSEKVVVPVMNSFPEEIENAFMDMIQDDKWEAKDRLPVTTPCTWGYRGYRGYRIL
jgi:hypothetical protein